MDVSFKQSRYNPEIEKLLFLTHFFKTLKRKIFSKKEILKEEVEINF